GRAVEIADRIRKAISSTNFNVGLDGERVAITLSMGVALSVQDDSSETLLQRADEALYIAKQAGRNYLHCEGQKAEPAEPAEAGV
ncbi:MAG: diguanylate cyclase, partial [Planctomycetes bacterium]|nr:diguanylate cyclase [Planctomycetota bacterium]